MGSPGYGAHLHIDAVEKPSWQAQIRGQKQWILEPPPECYFECPSSRISAIMITGDISNAIFQFKNIFSCKYVEFQL
eukprot:m.24544 g.24544  ORF g.24544 m.24544 type:complete len:77 (+) comp28638_c0_seq6:1475-1705(+)